MTPQPDNAVWHIATDDGAVLLDPASGRCYGLNPTAATIWTGLLAGATTEQITESLAAEHGVDLDRAHRDVRALLAALHEHGLTNTPRAAK